MKILFLASHLNGGGAERTIAYLSSYLANSGMIVDVVSLTDEVFYTFNPKVNLRTLSINKKAKNLVARIILAAIRFYKIDRIVEQNDYDVVFCMLPDVAKYVLNHRKRKTFKLLTSERINPDLYKGSKVLKFKEKIYSHSDGIIFQTKRALEFYPEHIRKKGVVIHNAVGNEDVYNAPHVDIRINKISAIGRLTDQKDYPTLFEAFKIVLSKYPEYTLEIFGDGPDKEKLIALTKELGIEANVMFMGVHKDAILQAADSACYVMSSKYEGMPNALMEAMAVGLPCVSTDCPNGPAELITNGENGVLVPVGDLNALADAMLKMIEDNDFAKKCGNNARNILNTHNVDVKAKEYMDFIMKIYNGE